LAILREILGRRHWRFGAEAAEAALTLGPPCAILPETLRQQPGWTLFQLDLPAGEAVFFDIGDANLFDAAFGYHAQFAAARRVARLPLAEFLALADEIAPPPHLVLLFNPGHCGSTLVHHIFNASGACWSLSETHFCFELGLEAADIPEKDYVALTRACLRCLSLLPHLKERPALVLKLTSQITRFMGRWQRAAPSAICLNLHRDALGYANSLFHFVQRLGIPADLPMEGRDFIWRMNSAATPPAWLEGILDLARPDLHHCEISAAGWALNLEWLRQARAEGVAFQTFHYQDLLAHREATLSALFQAAGLPSFDMAAALAAFDHAAHDGATFYETDQAISLTPAEHARIRALLALPRLGLTPESRP